LYAGGTFSTAGGVAATNIARWTNNAWQPLAVDGLNGKVRALAVWDRFVYVGGDFTNFGAYVARWDMDAPTWNALGTGTNGGVHALLATEQGLYVGGSFTTAGGLFSPKVARWNYAGSWTVMPGLGPGPGIVKALGVVGSQLLAGGLFTTPNGAVNLARRSGNTWLPVIPNDLDGQVLSMETFQNEDGEDWLCVGGEFMTAGGRACGGLFGWNGTSHSYFDFGLSGSVLTLRTSVKALLSRTMSDGKHLFAGGHFTRAGTDGYQLAGMHASWLSDESPPGD
jgi:hypothetical protein